MPTYDHHRVIAIDGPGAAGKSTVAVEVADQLDALLFDTGALYRVVTLLALRTGTPTGDGAALARLAATADIQLQPASVSDGRTSDVLLNGEDVTWTIRTPEIDANVSEVAAHLAVRQALLDVQREIADGMAAVLVGRDIGTVVIPNAGLKIYLDASTEERARRRHLEMQNHGVDTSYESILQDLRRRDDYDSKREVSPLRRADDAVVIETDGREVSDIVGEITSLARTRHLNADSTV
ncbi:MAG TPA: (d)CMP kinase [Thermomicrobiales bacterium]|nr:(d)CMP kinase [Thermomicrobiales bacterium]